MKITVEYVGWPNYKGETLVVYENNPWTKENPWPEGETWVDDDWDFLFESLKDHHDYLKLKAEHADSLGVQISIQAKADKLESLFKKYHTFIKMAEEDRYEI